MVRFGSQFDDGYEAIVGELRRIIKPLRVNVATPKVSKEESE
jgi:hypothetical protein